MQSITIIAVGKLNAKYYENAAAEYVKRLGAYCKIKVVEIQEAHTDEKKMSEALVQKALEKEAVSIMAAVPKNSVITAMCIEGKQRTSVEFADFFSSSANAGVSDITFVIGSSHGLAPSVVKAAAHKMSMSKMTFPHQLARVMLLEQIYRAFSINSGTKYHK